MNELSNKIDFAVLFTVDKANPNGDPLTGNRPREDFSGFGEMSDVCIKRKIRNRLQDMGENIFVQSDDRSNDGCKSLNERAKKNEQLQKAIKAKNDELSAQEACKTWIDVRSFGQVFAFKSDSGSGVSIGVRGPVSIQSAFSVSPVDVTSMQITKSVSGDRKADGGRSSDTMGMKHRVEFGLYVIKGSINCQLASKTGFSEEDAEKIKKALLSLFENDASSARPDGTMEIRKLYWWKHNNKNGQYSSAKVHRLLHVTLHDDVEIPVKYEDYTITLDMLDGLVCDEYEGI